MARTTKVIVVCDRHREDVEAVGSIDITVGGERRTLDLCAEHLAEINRVLRPWMRRATPASGRSRAPSGEALRPRKRSTDGPAIRSWARKHGYDLPARGRIPDAVREAFLAQAGKGGG